MTEKKGIHNYLNDRVMAYSVQGILELNDLYSCSAQY